MLHSTELVFFLPSGCMVIVVTSRPAFCKQLCPLCHVLVKISRAAHTSHCILGGIQKKMFLAWEVLMMFAAIIGGKDKS